MLSTNVKTNLALTSIPRYILGCGGSVGPTGNSANTDLIHQAKVISTLETNKQLHKVNTLFIKHQPTYFLMQKN